MVGCFGGPRIPSIPSGLPPAGTGPMIQMAYYASWGSGILMIAGFLGLIFYTDKHVCLQAIVAGIGLLVISQIMLWIGCHLKGIMISIGILTALVMVYLYKKKPNLVEELIGIDIPNYGDDRDARTKIYD